MNQGRINSLKSSRRQTRWKTVNDEDRIIKCRNELQTVAKTEMLNTPEISKLRNSICDTGCVQSRSDLEDEIKWSLNGFFDGKKCEQK